jgi:putative heme-binding domain-containing protein
VFHGAAQCAQCHALEGRGRAFGPDLRGIGRKYQRPELLQQIVSPSQTIAPEFRSITVTLKDGTDYTGFILRKTATDLVLKDSALVEHPLAMAQIAESRESTLSAMAEGLLAPLTAQEAADLLEYLLRTR